MLRRLDLRSAPLPGPARLRGLLPRAEVDVDAVLHQVRPIVDATGPTIDQGTLLRFLGEIIWFPGAALAPYLTWRALDDVTAEATMTHGGVTATARFTIDADGRVTGFRARRYMDDRTGAHLEDWYVPIDAWARFDGVEVATRGAVIWQLAAGNFEYYRWEITALEHDRPARFA